jgi:hypothetical protein
LILLQGSIPQLKQGAFKSWKSNVELELERSGPIVSFHTQNGLRMVPGRFPKDLIRAPVFAHSHFIPLLRGSLINGFVNCAECQSFSMYSRVQGDFTPTSTTKKNMCRARCHLYPQCWFFHHEKKRRFTPRSCCAACSTVTYSREAGRGSVAHLTLASKKRTILYYGNSRPLGRMGITKKVLARPAKLS